MRMQARRPSGCHCSAKARSVSKRFLLLPQKVNVPFGWTSWRKDSTERYTCCVSVRPYRCASPGSNVKMWNPSPLKLLHVQLPATWWFCW